ncbi:MAG TPA: hypothetical protein VGL98_17765 [Gammaproteobacteria bacterium]
MSELQKLQQLQQQQRWVVFKRDLLKRQPLPFVLLGAAMLAYVVIVWQWL